MSFIGDLFGANTKPAYGPITSQNVGVDQNIAGQQEQFANALANQMQGKGPSVANLQLQQALQQQQAGSAASAAGARGVNPALAMRTAMEQQGQASQAAAQSGAIGRAQEALGAQGQLGNTLSGMAGQNLQAQEANQAANLQAQLGTQAAAQQAAKGQSGLLGGLLGGAGSLLTGGMFHQGGEIKAGYADGGPVTDKQKSGPLSQVGKMLQSMSAGNKDPYASLGQGLGMGVGAGIKALFPKAPIPTTPTPAALSQGGKISALVSPGEIEVPADQARNPKAAAQYAAQAVRSGKKIPGKARVKGDSVKNDTIPAELEEGGIIVPRTKSRSPDDAAAFVRAIIASQRGKRS